MTYEDIIDELILETGGDVDDTDLRAKFLSYLKSSLRRFPQFSKDKFFFEQKTGTLSSGSRSMTLPAGMVDTFLVYVVTDNLHQKIEMPGPEVFNSKVNLAGSGVPDYGIIRGDTIEFEIAANQNLQILFESFVEVDDIEEADTFGDTSDKVEVMKDGAKMIYYDYQEDDAKSAKFENRFAPALADMKRTFNRRNSPTHVEEA